MINEWWNKRNITKGNESAVVASKSCFFTCTGIGLAFSSFLSLPLDFGSFSLPSAAVPSAGAPPFSFFDFFSGFSFFGFSFFSLTGFGGFGFEPPLQQLLSAFVNSKQRDFNILTFGHINTIFIPIAYQKNRYFLFSILFLRFEWVRSGAKKGNSFTFIVALLLQCVLVHSMLDLKCCLNLDEMYIPKMRWKNYLP